MGQLTGGIAHDFNNLLTVVMADLELAKSRLPVDSDAGARIERAMWGANRGAALTQQLLAFARKQTLIAGADRSFGNAAGYGEPAAPDTRGTHRGGPSMLRDYGRPWPIRPR